MLPRPLLREIVFSIGFRDSYRILKPCFGPRLEGPAWRVWVLGKPRQRFHSQDVCVWIHCATPHSIYTTCWAYIDALILGMLGRQLCGYDFLVIQPRWIVKKRVARTPKRIAQRPGLVSKDHQMGIVGWDSYRKSQTVSDLGSKEICGFIPSCKFLHLRLPNFQSLLFE